MASEGNLYHGSGEESTDAFTSDDNAGEDFNYDYNGGGGPTWARWAGNFWFVAGYVMKRSPSNPTKIMRQYVNYL